MKHFYCEHNDFGVDLSYMSIGWRVYRFASKQDRDTFVDENKWDGCNQVNAKISAKNINKILGSRGDIVVSESFRDLETGVKVEILGRAW